MEHLCKLLPACGFAWLASAPALSAQPSQGLRTGLREEPHREEQGHFDLGTGSRRAPHWAVMVMLSYRTRRNIQKTLDGFNSGSAPPNNDNDSEIMAAPIC